jgi:hypothetical protein
VEHARKLAAIMVAVATRLKYFSLEKKRSVEIVHSRRARITFRNSLEGHLA